MTTPTTYEGQVRFESYHNTEEGVRSDNIRATFERGYIRFNELMDIAAGRTVSLVGAGSSLLHTYKDIVGDIMACNSAHDFLVGKGVIPKYAMIWDANPIMAGVINRPHKDVIYLVASRCHPSVFEKLKDYRVIVWHALGGEDVEAFLVKHNRQEPMIGGGSSGVTRAMYLASAMGYKADMHLFGVCDGGDGTTHVIGSLTQQNLIRMKICGKWWTLAPWMALQAADFKTLLPFMEANGARVIVHGKGMLPYTATFLGCETPDIRISWHEKVKRKVHALIILYMELRASPQLLGGSNAGI